MTPQERKSMRRSQVERCLSADMTIKDWCALNKIPESTMYFWMARFRDEEPEMFGAPAAGDWIELTREAISARTALAVPGSSAPGTPLPAPGEGSGIPACAAVVVRLNGAEVVVPDGASQAHVAAVLGAVAGL